jgi:hypothetical protein
MLLSSKLVSSRISQDKPSISAAVSVRKYSSVSSKVISVPPNIIKIEYPKNNRITNKVWVFWIFNSFDVKIYSFAFNLPVVPLIRNINGKSMRK